MIKIMNFLIKNNNSRVYVWFKFDMHVSSFQTTCSFKATLKCEKIQYGIVVDKRRKL